ncbi:MAG: hypothetical protein DRR04_03485 [Gammaproteobacteria bacterium]|nr:MAG: hypothetical protein DRQ97_02205 [Gammaproteobacteria bacterium]RLA61226.1 MAG: hypothetical protein DRR04_03485 [Gammaproteobacteria bacterium]
MQDRFGLAQGSVAMQRYLQRHIEGGLPPPPGNGPLWHNALVIPAYREPSATLQHLMRLPRGIERTLVILVLNRPDADPDPLVNASLRVAVGELASTSEQPNKPVIHILNKHADLYVHDMEDSGGTIPAAQGVGLARKTGCDIALKWMAEGAISGEWIHSTDADALPPQDYFQQLERCNQQAVAAVYPFRHVRGDEQNRTEATALYELRLHHYVLGLEYAGSPYAYHTLGSCLAVKASAYAQVRGFPKRAGGEDFYLLNKLAKLGPVAKLTGNCIELQSRQSQRVPFGTGPAVEKITRAKHPTELPLFYHPLCFVALRALLATVPDLQHVDAKGLSDLLGRRGLERSLARACSDAIEAMGLEAALTHCRRQGKSPEQFLRQFHQWFDGFRSLKFIHAIRDAGWPQQSLHQLVTLQPRFWSGASNTQREVESLRLAVRRHWGWQS